MTQIKERSDTRDVFNTDEKDLDQGSHLPHGDGTVAPEQLHAVERGGVNAKEGPTGQDHSLENYEDSEPTGGVGGVQDYSDTGSDIAHIEE
ncbi:MAG TPA: hypothetical protein VIL74_25815 [Pyrinomonadaceae bacterium]|jgi:hypothetical protein